MELNDFALPIFAFLDGSEHQQPNITAGRSIIIHTPSHTIIEVVDMDDVVEMKISPEIITFDFVYHNSSGMKENHKMIVQYTTFVESELKDIFFEAAKWYSDYLTWEDDNIFNEED